MCRIECSSFLIEYDLAHRHLGVGAAEVRDPKVVSGETIVDRIGARGWLAPEQTTVRSSCGLRHPPRRAAMGKMMALTEAKQTLGG
jgi:methionine synthase II (cobalamin-independent)